MKNEKEIITYAKIISRESDGKFAFKTLYECMSCKNVMKFGYNIKYCPNCGERIEFDDDDLSAIKERK